MVLRSLFIVGLVISVTGQAQAKEKQVIAVDFTSTPVSTAVVDMLRTHTASKAIMRYTDGSTVEYPLAYRVLFKNTDKVGGSANEAGRLFDVDGKALVDLNGDPVVAETPDGNSLLNVDGKLFLLTHFEYDWILGNGRLAWRAWNWYSRMPMSMALTGIEQTTDGELEAKGQRPIDFAPVNGLWIPCFASQTPWNTHLGAEEDYDLFLTKASGEGLHRVAVRGLRALEEVYFKGEKKANPYHYGYIIEVKVNKGGSAEVAKHYQMGRASWEQALVMPDRRTVYFGDDGNHVGLFMFLADEPDDLSSGTIYAARWSQIAGDDGGRADLSWVRLGRSSSEEARRIIDSGIRFEDIFEYTTSKEKPNWQAAGFHAIRAGHSVSEYLKLKPGMEKAAAILETRRYAAYLGATTEFNKMEGVAVDPQKKHLYLAISYIRNGMLKEGGASADHIRVGKLNAGAVYRIVLKSGQSDVDGSGIDSDWVGVSMQAPVMLRGEDTGPDKLGNTANLERIANPDNLFFSPKLRTLFVAEDSGARVNNFLWAYHVDSGRLTRILSIASGGESTGLQVVENLNGHAYIMSNVQHRGEWIGTIPPDMKERLTKAAAKLYGVNDRGVPNYQLQAPVGYIGGMPGFE